MIDDLHKLELLCYLAGVIGMFPGAFVMGMDWQKRLNRKSSDKQKESNHG